VKANPRLSAPTTKAVLQVLSAFYKKANGKEDSAPLDVTKTIAVGVAKNDGKFFIFSREQPRCE
jgi:hypothetical protein